MYLRRAWNAALFPSILLLAACATPANLGAPPVPVADLIGEPAHQETGTSLRPGDYSGESVILAPDSAGFSFDARVSEFYDGQGWTFTVGCNTIDGFLNWQVKPESGVAIPLVSEFRQTLMGCPGDLGAAENVLVENLNSGDFQIIDSEHFRFGDITFAWHPAPEPGPIPDLPTDGEYTIGFEEDVSDTGYGKPDIQVVKYTFIGTATVTENGTVIHFDAGCNQISAPLADGELGPVRSTRMFCAESDDREQILLEQLNSGPFEMLSEDSFMIGGLDFRLN